MGEVREVYKCARCKGTRVQAQVYAWLNNDYHVPEEDRRDWCVEGRVYCHDCRGEQDVEVKTTVVGQCDRCGVEGPVSTAVGRTCNHDLCADCVEVLIKEVTSE